MKEVLYFSASWCVPCKQMKPIVEGLEAETGVSFRVINVDSDYEAASKYNVKSVPSFVPVEDGKEISRAVGAQTGKELAAALSI